MQKKTFPRQIDFIAMGCSAGGIEALKFLLNEIPAGFSVPIGIVQHRSPDSNGMMIRYFKDVSPLEVIEPDDKEPIRSGAVYFAPANYHMLIGEDFCFHLSVDEPVHFSRPSIDVFLSSAANVYQKNLLGIVMSGANVDGAEGLYDVKYNGGLTVVQDPSTAFHAVMPEAARTSHSVDYVYDLAQIRQLICSLPELERDLK